MDASLIWTAVFFGALSGAPLVLGAALGVRWRPPQRPLAAIIAFGAGALLSALSFELILNAQEHGGFAPVLIGGLIGGALFVGVNEILNDSGAFLRKRATTNRYLREQKRREAEALLERLSRVHILRALPPAEIQWLVTRVAAVSVPAGAHIYEQGTHGDALYLIDEGQVELVLTSNEGADGTLPQVGTQSEVVSAVDLLTEGLQVARYRPHEVFGELALLTGEPRQTTAVAITDTTLWRVGKDDFDELVAVSPELARAVEQLLARDLQEVSQANAGDETDEWHRVARRYVEAHALTPTSVDVRKAAIEHADSAPMSIFLGALLDGIPESLVLGMSLLGSAVVSAPLIVGLCLSNLPEALSSAVGMKAQGMRTRRVVGIWFLLFVFTILSTVLGAVLFTEAPDTVVAVFEAVAAGAMLTMVAETMLPEAYEHGGWLSGIGTLLGFLTAFFVRTLSGMH